MEIFKISMILYKFTDLNEVLQSIYGRGLSAEDCEMYFEYALNQGLEYNERVLRTLLYAERLDRLALRDVLRATYKQDLQEDDKEKHIEYIESMEKYIKYLSGTENSQDIIENKDLIKERKKYRIKSMDILNAKKDVYNTEELEGLAKIDNKTLALELIALYKIVDSRRD